MAKLTDIKLMVDSFFTDTRISLCRAFLCTHLKKGYFICNLKEVKIDETGVCENFKKE